MILWTIVLISVLHILVFVCLIVSFLNLPTPEHNPFDQTFSVIVPIRNEEKNITKLLWSLNRLDYDRNKFEIIVIDDSSEDNTLSKLKSFEPNFNLRILELGENILGKKAGIEYGVRQAKNEIIITTDGDCLVPKKWLKAFDSAFNQNTKLVVGPVKMSHKTLFSALQAFDFNMLIGYAAGLISRGIPSTSNGANLAYRKEVFEQVKGYQDNEQIPSGDDEFLLLKVVRKFPRSIAFLRNADAVVITEPKPTFKKLLNQRVRWMSKWSIHKKIRITLSVWSVLIDNLFMIIGIVGLICNFFPIWTIGVLLGRILIKLIFIASVNKVLKDKVNPLVALIYELVYPFFVLRLSFASIFGHYTWKGRKY